MLPTKKAIDGGVEMFIVANIYDDQTNNVINAIAQLVKDGEVDRKRISAIYNKIANFKKKRLQA